MKWKCVARSHHLHTIRWWSDRKSHSHTVGDLIYKYNLSLDKISVVIFVFYGFKHLKANEWGHWLSDINWLYWFPSRNTINNNSSKQAVATTAKWANRWTDRQITFVCLESRKFIPVPRISVRKYLLLLLLQSSSFEDDSFLCCCCLIFF